MILKSKEAALTNQVQFVWVSQGNRQVIAFDTEDEAVAWKLNRDAKLPLGYVVPELRLVMRTVEYKELEAA